MASSASREKLIDVGERLFAEHGIEAVSLRQIAASSGQRNHSAIQYHFEDKLGLVRAILQRRLPPANELRRAQLAELDRRGEGQDLTALVAAVVHPFLEASAQVGSSHHARFLAAVVACPEVHGELSLELTDALREVLQRIRKSLAHLPRATVKLRLNLMVMQVVHALAERERELVSGAARAGSLGSRGGIAQLIHYICGGLDSDPPGVPAASRHAL